MKEQNYYDNPKKWEMAKLRIFVALVLLLLVILLFLFG